MRRQNRSAAREPKINRSWVSRPSVRSDPEASYGVDLRDLHGETTATAVSHPVRDARQRRAGDRQLTCSTEATTTLTPTALA